MRIQATVPFRLRWSKDGWSTFEDTTSDSTSLRLYFVDFPAEMKTDSIEFTFFWIDSNNWEGRNYRVAIRND